MAVHARKRERDYRGTGLDRLVDAWCVSEIEGSWKPSVPLLAIAAERCGESLSDAWMIGDGPDTDILAADTAGIPSVWLRHGRAWPREDFRPTFEASSFAEKRWRSCSTTQTLLDTALVD